MDMPPIYAGLQSSHTLPGQEDTNLDHYLAFFPKPLLPREAIADYEPSWAPLGWSIESSPASEPFQNEIFDYDPSWAPIGWSNESSPASESFQDFLSSIIHESDEMSSKPIDVEAWPYLPEPIADAIPPPKGAVPSFDSSLNLEIGESLPGSSSTRSRSPSPSSPKAPSISQPQPHMDTAKEASYRRDASVPQREPPARSGRSGLRYKAAWTFKSDRKPKPSTVPKNTRKPARPEKTKTDQKERYRENKRRKVSSPDQSSSPSSTSSLSSSVTPSKSRRSHNDTEKRYRCRLNGQFETLLLALPPSLVAENGYPSTPDTPGEKDKDKEKKISKAEVLTLAMEYTASLEKEMEMLLLQNQSLTKDLEKYESAWRGTGRDPDVGL